MTERPWTPFLLRVWDDDEKELNRQKYLRAGANPDMLEQARHERVFRNSRYTVHVTDLQNGWTHLSIKRNDREPCRDWRDFQRIKNELTEPEREAVELFPAESRLVDAANQYHLWVAPLGIDLGIGFHNGRNVGTPEEAAAIGAKQREMES